MLPWDHASLLQKGEPDHPSLLSLQFPLGKKLAGIFEPTVAATIITPTAHVGAIMQLAQDRRGDMSEHTLLGPERTLLKYALRLYPLYMNVHDQCDPILRSSSPCRHTAPTLGLWLHDVHVIAILLVRGVCGWGDVIALSML